MQIGERGTRAQYRSEPQMGLRRLGTESSPDFLVQGAGFEPSVPRQRALFETASFELAFPMGRESTAASNLYSSTAEYG